MAFLKVLFLLSAVMSLSACTHLNTKINDLPFHTSKSDTLDKLGRPFKIQRKQGLDRWVYKFKWHGKKYTKAILFKDGHFLKKESLRPYPDPKILLEESKNFKEYEQAVKILKKRKKELR